MFKSALGAQRLLSKDLPHWSELLILSAIPPKPPQPAAASDAELGQQRPESLAQASPPQACAVRGRGLTGAGDRADGTGLPQQEPAALAPISVLFNLPETQGKDMGQAAEQDGSI